MADLKGKSFAFGDKGSTSGYLIPFHYFQKQGIDPEKYFSKTLYTKHQAIETSVTRGELDAGADYNRNRNAMADELKTNPALLPAHYTGFVKSDNGFYKPIRDAGLATGKLAPKK